MQPEKIIFETDTKLGHYQVVDMVYVGRPARVLFSGKRSAAQSAIPKDNNGAMLFDYNRRFLELADCLKPKKILVIGGGAFTLPLEILKNFPDTLIDTVELDTGVVEIAERFFGLKPHKNLNIIISDGREYLSSSKNTYDLIIVDAFFGNKIPLELSTYEFANLLSSRLTKNGVCVTNIISSYHGPKDLVMKQQFSTYHAVFKHVDIFPADNSITYWVSQNFILAATNKRLRPKYNLQFKSLKPPVTYPENILHDK